TADTIEELRTAFAASRPRCVPVIVTLAHPQLLPEGLRFEPRALVPFPEIALHEPLVGPIIRRGHADSVAHQFHRSPRPAERAGDEIARFAVDELSEQAPIGRRLLDAE